MIKQIIIVAVVVQLVYSNSVDSRCRRLSDCPCGEACVQKNSDKTCDERSNKVCECKAGCGVYDMFVPASQDVEVYGNSCKCGEGGKAACTMKPWLATPEGVPVHENNSNC